MLDSVVKERWVDSFVSTEARILQQPHSLSSAYFQKFFENLLKLQTLDSLRSLVSGRRILQRFNSLSTTFFTASDLADRNPSELTETCNSLITKEFRVPLSLEVGRIIRR